MKKRLPISSIAIIGITLLFLCLSPALLPAQDKPKTTSPSPWLNSFRDARETATAEKKDLAILFTASDWLDLAKTFDQEILNQKEFLDAATSAYTLVRLDLPKDTSIQPQQITVQNQLLMRAYRVQGLPTLVLTDNLGRPYAITGYHDAGLGEWVKEFKQFRQTREKRDRLFAAAEKAQGLERAKLLVEALPELPGNLAARFYRNVLNEIIKLDPDNQTGQIGHYKLLIADVSYVDQMQKLMMKGEQEKMLELSDHYLKNAKLEGDSRQAVLFNKLGVYEKLGRKNDMEKTLNEIIATDADSSQGKQAAELLKKLKQGK